MIRIPEGSAPDFKNKSWTVGAEITVPPKGADGILATMGGRFGGWGLWVANGKPEFAYALSNQPQHKFKIIVVRFSLDETFDVGEDTGTPVVEDYVNKMPYVFTGTLKKLVVVLEPDKLTEDERARLLKEAANAYMAAQ